MGVRRNSPGRRVLKPIKPKTFKKLLPRKFKKLKRLKSEVK